MVAEPTTPTVLLLVLFGTFLQLCSWQFRVEAGFITAQAEVLFSPSCYFQVVDPLGEKAERGVTNVPCLCASPFVELVAEGFLSLQSWEENEQLRSVVGGLWLILQSQRTAPNQHYKEEAVCSECLVCP